MSAPLGEYLLQDEAAEEDAEGEGADEGLSSFSAIVMNVNMVVGAGVVGLPYAFYHAGALLGVVALLIATLMSSATMGYLVEVMAWCELQQEEDEKIAAEAVTEDEEAETAEGGERGEEEEGDGAGKGKEGWGKGLAAGEVLVFKGRKLEISEMCGLVFPCQVRRVLEFCLLCYTFGSLWLYSTVFASSLSLVVPLPIAGRPLALANCLVNCQARESEGACTAPCLWANASSGANASSSSHACASPPGVAEYCDASYELFLVLFAVLMLSLACLDMKGLKNMQLAMGFLALTSLATMVLTCAAAILYDDGETRGADSLPPTNLDGMGKLVTAAIFSQICHQATPNVVSNMREKRSAKFVFRCTLYYTFFLYVTLCMVTTYFFGDKTVPIITLNWEDYTGGSAPGVPISWWASIISTSVLVFPVVSVSAAYPLNVIPLAETIQSMTAPSSPPGGSEAGSTLPLRAALTVFPIMCAAALKDVSKILEFNGMFGFVIAFFVPCSLYIAARSYASKRWGPQAVMNGHWSWPASTVWCVWAVLATSILVAAYTFYQVILDYSGRQR